MRRQQADASHPQHAQYCPTQPPTEHCVGGSGQPPMLQLSASGSPPARQGEPGSHLSISGSTPEALVVS